MPLYTEQELRLYNSISGKKETFNPITPGYVGMYVCGPTVYSNVHLGNVRTFMSFDVIFRYLKHLGYKIRYVRNITDAGHLENDEDAGEDRIAKKARIEKIEPMEVVQRYTVDFHDTLNKFNLLPPSIEPTATGHIVEQIELVKEIINNGFGYEVNGSVYFDVLKFNKTNTYGKLSKRNIENLIHNTRDLEGQSDKKNPQDFALWKRADPEHIMRWPSPWSDGFPGWHLECTTMSTKYLGNHFDIHGGGLDLKFPHHECEIAQSEASKGSSPVNYWLHANLLIMNGKKMSKSTGNFILPNEIFTGNNPNISKAYTPNVARFFMLQAHYRSVLDFTDKGLQASEKGLNRLMEGIKLLNKLKADTSSSFKVDAWKQSCYDAMNDDFNTPILIAQLFEAVKHIHLINDGKASLTQGDLKTFKTAINAFIFDVLGLTNEPSITLDSEQLSGAVKLLITLRQEARVNKDFATSDKIRDELADLGINLLDGKEGTSFTLK